MSKKTLREAIREWEAKEGKRPDEADEVKLNGMHPPIDRLDENLNLFENCTKLSLSSNAIDRFVALPKLKNLKILSLGRNNIKRIMSLDEVGQTLEELWISYNQIEKLDGLQPCVKLHTLYIGNNKINNWAEVQKLSSLPAIKSVLLVGNPIYDDSETNATKKQHLEMLKPYIEEEMKKKTEKNSYKEVEDSFSKIYWIFRTVKRLPMLEQCDNKTVTPQFRSIAEFLE